MIIHLGPITLMDSKTREAYRVLANKAYMIHQNIWYADDFSDPRKLKLLKQQDAELSEAISHVPASDIES